MNTFSHPIKNGGVKCISDTFVTLTILKLEEFFIVDATSQFFFPTQCIMNSQILHKRIQYPQVITYA